MGETQADKAIAEITARPDQFNPIAIHAAMTGNSGPLDALAPGARFEIDFIDINDDTMVCADFHVKFPDGSEFEWPLRLSFVGRGG